MLSSCYRDICQCLYVIDKSQIRWMTNQNSKTEIVTLRLSSALVAQLRQEANGGKLSLNAYVSQILYSHIELHSPAFAAGMFPFPKKLVSSMLRELDKGKIEGLSQQMAHHDFVDLAYMTKSSKKDESFISTLLAWARHSGFPVQDVMDGSTRIIILKHDMGSKWSFFMSRSIKHYFDYFHLDGVNFEIPNDVLVIKIRNPPN